MNFLLKHKIKTGTISFIFQRITGTILVLFLFSHVLFGQFTVPAKPVFSVILLLILLHALNGLRLIALDLGLGVHIHKITLWILVSIAFIIWLLLI